MESRSSVYAQTNGHTAGTAAPSPTPSRAALIRAARAESIVDFPLPNSGGAVARVRRLSLIEAIASGAIPAHLTNAVNAMLGAGVVDDASGPTAARMMDAAGGPVAALANQMALVDASCILGFVDPQLVATEAEVTDLDRQLWVGDIQSADRLAYWTWCQGEEDGAALAPSFPQPTGEPVAPAHPRPTGLPVWSDTLDLSRR